MSFSIGDLVLCVDDSMQPHTIEVLKKIVPNWVKKDKKYTIRDIKNNRGISTGVLLEEIDNPIVFIDLIGCYQEPAFAEWRFRKIKNEENMIEVCQELLEMV